MGDLDRAKLPIRRPPFQGVCNRTLDGSRPDWNLIGHPEPPEGSPNVLLVLIDDAGFGNPSTVGGPINTPRFTQMAEAGLRYNRFHRAVLADASGPAHRTQQPYRRLRLGRRVLQWLPRLHGDDPEGLHTLAEGPVRERIQHRGVRQVAFDA
jgi:arylsulfatase